MTLNNQVVRNKVWRFLLEASTTKLLLVFVGLALASLGTKFVLVAFFYFLLLSFLFSSINDQKQILPYLLISIIPIELLGRMLGADPFLPWELGKYIGVPLFIYGILSQGRLRSGGLGLWIIVLSIPGVLLSFVSSDEFYKDFVFSYLGLFNLGLAIIYFSNRALSAEQIIKMFRFFIAGSFTVLVYVIIKAPTLAQMNFELVANFKVTAGFGSNQVATVLATAFGLGIYIWLVHYSLFRVAWLNLALPTVFLLWSIITFSRGGVATSIVAIVLIILLSPKGKHRFQVRAVNPSLIIVLGIITVGLGYWANELTKGQLLLRYSGETYATVNANKEKDLSTLTSSRSDIFLSDLEVWREHFLFGVGIGRSDNIRGEMGKDDTIAHVEISRILSEHGFFGLIIILLFLVTPLVRYIRARGSFQTSLVILCFTIAIVTSMHSAMRTFTTPFFYGLAFVKLLVPVKEEQQNQEDLIEE